MLAIVLLLSLDLLPAQVVYTLRVEGLAVPLRVHVGDKPSATARAFCAAHSLDHRAHAQLSAHLCAQPVLAATCEREAAEEEVRSPEAAAGGGAAAVGLSVGAGTAAASSEDRVLYSLRGNWGAAPLEIRSADVARGAAGVTRAVVRFCLREGLGAAELHAMLEHVCCADADRAKALCAGGAGGGGGRGGCGEEMRARWRVLMAALMTSGGG